LHYICTVKFKLPRILSFTKYIEEYSMVPEKVELSAKNKSTKLILFEEDKSAERKRNKVVELLKKHESALREIEEAMVTYAREMTVDFPQISLMTVTKRNNMTDNKYYNARVIFPERDGKTTEYRIYIGPKSNYPDINDPETMVLIQQKIAKKIKEKRGWIYPDGKYKDSED